MKYFWDIDTIKSQIKEANDSNSEFVIDKAKIYSRMLVDLSVPKKEKTPKIIKEKFFEQIDNFDINYFDNSIFKLISYFGSQISDFDIDFDLNYHDKKNGNVIVKICKDFYKRNDKDSLQYFKKIIQRNDRIYFNENKSSSFMGRAYIISSSDYYILINGRNYLEDSLALIHETKHVEQVMKGYNKGISHYEELSSILYELYMIDYLHQVDDNKSNVSVLQMQNLDKYINKINVISECIDFIKKIKDDDILYENIKVNYDLYYDIYHLEDVYNILNYGISDKDIGTIISFIVALHIYLNSNMSNINNVLSCYIFGIYKMKPNMLDNVLEYITSMYRPYMLNDTNIKKKKLQKLY